MKILIIIYFLENIWKLIIFYVIDVKFTPSILFCESICNFNLTYDIEFFSSANIFFFFFFALCLFVQPQIICSFNKLWKWIISIDKIFAKNFGPVSSWNRRSKKAFMIISKFRNMEKKTLSIFLKILNINPSNTEGYINIINNQVYVRI